MVIPHRKLSIDINRPNQYTVDFIAHVGDKNTRYIDITFNADGEPIELEQGCTATVTYVSDGVLIEQEAECDVNGSTVIVGIDTGKVENLRSGILEIQPKIVDGSGNIIVSQIPVLVRISPDIAEHGQVDDDSLGSYAEVVREIAAARGSYTDLKERLDHTGAPTDEQVAEAVEDYLDEHPVVPNGSSIWKTTTAPTAPDAEQNLGYGFNISDLTGADRDVQIGDMVLYSYYYYTVTEIIGSVAYADTRVSIRGAKGATYNLTDKDKTDIAGLVDVSGKENTSNKKTSISNQSQEGDSDTNYPTVGAVRDFVNLVKSDLEDYVDDETNGKADKSTTLSGYGITDAYTKAEVDELINKPPAYVAGEADRVTNVVANHQGNRVFNIGVITDMHIYSDNYPEDTATDTYYNFYAARHACQGLARISKSIHLDAFAMLGDYIVGDQSMGYTDGVVKINRLAADIKSDREIRLIGNHDYGFRVNQGYAPSFVYPFVTAYNSGMVMGDKVKGYGYYDNEEFKIRVIALNTTEYDGTGAPAAEYNISDAQKIWFANALKLDKSAPNEWQILILSHHPVDWLDSSNAGETDLVSILKAYKSGNTITIAQTTIDFNGSNSAVVIGNFHGHLHNYLSGTIYGTNYKRWCCPSACFDSTNRYYSVWREATTHGKTIRSAEDTAFAVFAIDLDNYTVTRIHYGAGYDTIDDVYYTSSGYTNVVPTSINTDGTIYNVIGYADGYRIGSSGSPSAYSGSVATGYIAAVKGDVIRFKGVDWNVTDTGSEHSEKCYFVECNSSFSVVGSYRNDQYTLTKDGDIYICTVGYNATAYIRINGIGSGENLIVTVNEEIN